MHPLHCSQPSQRPRASSSQRGGTHRYDPPAGAGSCCAPAERAPRRGAWTCAPNPPHAPAAAPSAASSLPCACAPPSSSRLCTNREGGRPPRIISTFYCCSRSTSTCPTSTVPILKIRFAHVSESPECVPSALGGCPSGVGKRLLPSNYYYSTAGLLCVALSWQL